MKKILFGFLLLSLLWQNFTIPVTVKAKEQAESEEIEDEKTPQNNRRSTHYQTLLIAFASASILILIIAATAEKRKKLKLFVERVEDNKDGSYTVTWGYQNPKNTKIQFDEEDAGLKVKKGTAIVLKQQNSSAFEPGLHREAIITVINDGTEIEWIAGNQKVGVNGEMIKIERRDENEKI